MVKFAYKLIILPSAILYKFLKIIILRGGTKMNNVQRVNECNQETVNTSNLNEKFEIRISKFQLKKVIENLISSLDIKTFAVIVSTFFRLYENKCETITLPKESDITSLKEYICNVAIPTFEDAIIKTEDVENIFNFVSNINGANISKFEDAIIETKDARKIYLFAKIINGANKSQLEDAIIKTGDAEYIFEFAMQIEGANISRLEDAIIETGNAEYIFKFTSDINGANISKLEDAIIEIRDAKYIYDFAHNIKGANISRLEDAIIETGNAQYIYCFARDIKGANISRLEIAAIKVAVENHSIEDIIFLKLTLNSSKLQPIADEIKFYNLFN